MAEPFHLEKIATEAQLRTANSNSIFSLFANSAITVGPIGMGEALIDVFRSREDDGAY